MRVQARLQVSHPPRLSSVRWMGIERSSTAFFLIGLTLATILYRFPPDRYPFYPVCPIHQYLHLLCPGCGVTRALSALLHGQLKTALHLNAFAILVLLPLAMVYALVWVDRSRKDGFSRPPTVPGSVAIGVAVLAAAFSLVRNL